MPFDTPEAILVLLPVGAHLLFELGEERALADIPSLRGAGRRMR